MSSDIPTLNSVIPSASPTPAAVKLPSSGGNRHRTTNRSALLDALRVAAANLIVWHHLAFYGPLSDGAYPLVPGLMDFLFERGRYAVQVFFVLGGFVAAASLGKRETIELTTAWTIIQRRYIRIAGPYLVVLLIAIGANWLADQWMDHTSISAFPTIPQFLAHTVFLQDLLGFEALTAGIWYLAIDFQLYLMALFLLLISQRVPRLSGISTEIALQLLVFLLASLSLYFFNRDSRWEPWAIYFFGSYALGLLTFWALSDRISVSSYAVYLCLMVLAIAVEWRTRLVVSLATGIIVYGAGRCGWLFEKVSGPWLALAGQWSYSLFLVHFPVCLVVNAWCSSFAMDSPALCLAGMIAAYGLSLSAAIVFSQGVERAFR